MLRPHQCDPDVKLEGIPAPGPAEEAPPRLSTTGTLGTDTPAPATDTEDNLQVQALPHRRPLRLSLAVILALGPGVLICVVGFLAWGLPFQRLNDSILPLAETVRAQVLNSIAADVYDTWCQMHDLVVAEAMRWDESGAPTDAYAAVESFGRLQYPLMKLYDHLVASPLVTFDDHCINCSAILKDPELGIMMDLQRCSYRTKSMWNTTSQTVSDLNLQVLAPMGKAQTGLDGPINNCTPANRFTWIPIFNPNAGIGDIFEASMALFTPAGRLYGRVALSVSTQYLRDFLQDIVDAEPVTRGGRLTLFEATGMVIAATHGVYNMDHRSPLAAVGDADLEGAAVLLQGQFGGVCQPTSLEVSLSVRYFLDVRVMVDPHPSAMQLRWCSLLLTPRSNILATVDSSHSFAIIFVCCMTISITALCLFAGLLVTRVIRQLARGMAALKNCEFDAARRARGGPSWFAELARAQASYASLVEAVDTFGKYVPHNVVRGLLEGSVRPGLGMAPERVAVAFLDVEDFTHLCEATPPEDIVALTSALFDRCCDIILAARGTIDKFIGDCIMALWGTPVFVVLPSRHALEAVLTILRFLREEPVLLPTGQALGFRIGLHSGLCLAGNFGTETRWDYTVIGDVVNTAARLEALNKQFGTRCLASSAVRDDVAAIAGLPEQMRPMGDVLLVGKQ
eukprot:EG_transcript_5283